MRRKVLAALSDPTLAFVVFIAGLLFIYVECVFPGAVLPGVAGGVAVAVALSAIGRMPLNWHGVLLIAGAVALFVAEAAYRLRGAAGLAGIVVMVMGAVLLIDGPRHIHWRTAAVVTIPFAVSTIFLLNIAMQARSNKMVSPSAALIGKSGEARTLLDPAGKVFLDGELWDARAARTVPAGSKVRIVAIQGLSLSVDRTD